MAAGLAKELETGIRLLGLAKDVARIVLIGVFLLTFKVLEEVVVVAVVEVVVVLDVIASVLEFKGLVELETFSLLGFDLMLGLRLGLDIEDIGTSKIESESKRPSPTGLLKIELRLVVVVIGVECFTLGDLTDRFTNKFELLRIIFLTAASP